MIGKWNKSVILTYIGLTISVLGIMLVLFDADLKYVMICLIVAGICDLFDGTVARRCKRTKEEKEFGIQIDSLADTVNFLCLPVVIMLSLGMNNILHLIIYCIFNFS